MQTPVYLGKVETHISGAGVRGKICAFCVLLYVLCFFCVLFYVVLCLFAFFCVFLNFSMLFCVCLCFLLFFRCVMLRDLHACMFLDVNDFGWCLLLLCFLVFAVFAVLCACSVLLTVSEF